MNRISKRLLAAVLIASILFGMNEVSFATEAADGSSTAGTEEPAQEIEAVEEGDAAEDAEDHELAHEEGTTENHEELVHEEGATENYEEPAQEEEERKQEEDAGGAEGPGTGGSEEPHEEEKDAWTEDEGTAAAGEADADAKDAPQGEKEVFSAGELVCSGEGFEVTLTHDEQAEIPADARLDVREFLEGTPEYDDCLKGAGSVMDKSVAKARFFDITILSDGQEIQPRSAVRVNITYEDAIEVADEGEVTAVHFEENAEKPEILMTDTDDPREVSGIAFDAESFSVYGIIYTVDFTYGGFTFSIPGEGNICLSELAEILGLYETDLDREFSIGNVSDVTFTDNALVRTEKRTDGDWLLISLASFTSEETLTVTMSDGVKFVITVTDPPAGKTEEGTTENTEEEPAVNRRTGDTDLRDALESVTITGNGQTIDANSDVTLVRGIQYKIGLSFMETDSHQFVDDDATMYYVLPIDFGAADVESGTFDMEFGSLGTLSGNTYVVEGNLLKVNWNTENEQMMEILRAADNAHFSVSIWCIFNTDLTTVEWNDDIITYLTLEDVHEASVTKNGSYNRETDCIDYVVAVTSEGSTTGISITDSITGSALTSNVHSIDDITVLKNGLPFTVSDDSLTVEGNHFVLNLPDMRNGDRYEVRYSAGINYGALGGNGITKYNEMNNSVELDYEENPDPPKESNSYEYNIIYSSVQKTFTDVSDISSEDGKKYRTITWEINANTEQKVPVDHITDTIRADSQGVMRMDGTGVTIEAAMEDGTVRVRTLAWGEDGSNGKLTVNSDYSWTYIPPASDGKAAYKITYQTIAEVTALADPTPVNNDVGTGYGRTGSGTTVRPDSEGVSVVKSVTAVSQEEVAWNVDVTVPADGTAYTRLTDYIPRNLDGGYIDTYRTCSVTGLEPDESYTMSFGFGRLVKYNFYNDFVLEYEDTAPHDPEDIIGEVYIDFRHLENGNWVDGLKITGKERNIQVQIVTENQEEWLDAAETAYWRYYEHTNTAKFANVRAEATAAPSRKHITKGLKIKNGTVTLRDGKTYPYYKYEVILEGASDDRIEIFDTFDTEVFEILDLDDLNPSTYQWNNPFLPEREGHGYIEDRRDAATKVKEDSHVARFTPTGNGVLISTEGLDRTDSGLLYPVYKINYYLVMKHPEKAAEKALAAGGKTTFTNTAAWDGAKSEAGFEYGNPVVDKSLVLDESRIPVRARYTIVVNPDRLKLNNGNAMTLVDDFSNTLSIDYTSIAILTDPADRGVTYDYYGHTGVYQIPDETKVTITYDCNVLGDDGTVRIYNRATLEGQFSDHSEEYLIIDSEGEGGAGIVYLDLLKYASGNMQDGSLAGAEFRLLDSEKNPVRYTSRAADPSMAGQEITFTTGPEGVLRIMLSRHRHGITFKKNTVFYLEEVKAPEGYQLDPTLYSFVISADPADAEYTREDGIWVYYVGDILKVRNTPETQSLVVTKRFAGNVPLTAQQKEKIRFIIQKVDETGNPVTGDDAFTKTVRYLDMQYDRFTITEETADDNGRATFAAGYYNVTEEYEGGLGALGLETNVVAETMYSITADGGTVVGEYVIGEDSVTAGNAHVSAGLTTNVVFTNRYFTGAYYFTKIDGGTEEPLAGAEFSVFKAGNDTVAETTYTTGTDGRFVISKAGDDLSAFDEDTLYYVVETGAPEGYAIPDPAPRYYFYFGAEGKEAPQGAAENNAVNLYEGNVYENVANISDGSIMVIKKWKEANGTDIPDSGLMDKSVTVTLRRKTGTGDDAAVDPGFARQQTLTIQDGFCWVWEDLEKTDGAGGAYYYFVEETDAPEGFTAVYSNNAGVMADGSGEITITNTKDESGLSVQKTVESAIESDRTREFRFTVTLDDDTVNGTYGGMVFENGTAVFTLKDGETKSAAGLAKGTGYTVTEDHYDGFTTIYSGETGTIGSGMSLAAVTNRKENGKIKVKKTVTGNMGSRTKQFGFTVTLKNADNTPYANAVPYAKETENGTLIPDAEGRIAFTLSHGEEIELKDLALTTKYTVTEEDCRTDGYTTSSENAEGTVTGENPDAVFVNNKDGDVPTGFSSLPKTGLILAVAAMLVIAAVCIRRKRKR